MPNHVDDVLLHAMDGSELSRVRTEFNQLRILPIVSPHPVQPNSEFSGHGHFGNSFFPAHHQVDRKSTRLNSSHQIISYAVFCLKKKKRTVDTSVRGIERRYGPGSEVVAP